MADAGEGYAPPLSPSFFSTIPAGQKPVNALWTSMTPTSPVKNRRFWDTKRGHLGSAIAADRITKVPATTRTPFSTVMTTSRDYRTTRVKAVYQFRADVGA
jgi:hypothetical protein